MADAPPRATGPFPSQFGPTPMNIACPYCRRAITTKLKYKVTMKTHIIAVILCIGTCLCCWIPYVCHTCQRPNHYCPSCKNFLGSCED